MSKIMLMPKTEIAVRGNKIKVYSLGGMELGGEISGLSVEPLRILTHVLVRKNISCQIEVNNGDPWDIEKIYFDDKYAEVVKQQLEEIMIYRCSFDANRNFKEIIRQLPYEVAMRTSDNIMKGKKDEEEHAKDLISSNYHWEMYNQILGIGGNSNPNNTVDNLEVKDSVLKKHLIYKSARGGYNIKTLGYSDSSLDHYSFIDSRSWD